jgi:exopolysaccharide production protein ExoZ
VAEIIGKSQQIGSSGQEWDSGRQDAAAIAAAACERRPTRSSSAAMDLTTSYKAEDARPERPKPASAPPAVAADSAKSGTILSIQILRFVAAFGVVMFHSYFSLSTHSGRAPGYATDAFGLGASGVHVFFVISGFVMVYTSWRSRLTPGKFLSRRLIRIYPIYWVVAAIYLVAHLFIGTPYALSGAESIGAALLVPGQSSQIIGPGWTLSFEMYFYLCFTIALIAGLNRGLVLLSAFFVASIAAGLLLGAKSPVTGLVTNSLLLEFMGGAWLGYAFARGRSLGRRTGGLLVVAAIGLFAAGVLFGHGPLPTAIVWGIPALMLVAGGLAFEPELRSPLGRGIAKLGDSSYLLYLSHVLLLDLLLATPINLLNTSEEAAILLSFPLAIACTIIAAVGYEILELPLLNLMKRMFLRRPKRRLQASTATP